MILSFESFRTNPGGLIMDVTVRFAPSPTGMLHVGGARTALFNWLFARKHQGTFLLRIEDTDTARSTRENVDIILEGLTWLGLDWDAEPCFQSRRMDLYQQRIQELIQDEKVYACYCTRERIQKAREEAAKQKKVWEYDGRCRRLEPDEISRLEEAGAPKAYRFRVPPGKTVVQDIIQGKITIEHERIEDFVLQRSDGGPTYHLAAVADDIDMKVTHVIRGSDHINNTPKQILLYEAFGAAPPAFAHLPLILGPDKSRLSKRHGATSVTAYRDAGYLSRAMVNFLALLGWSPGDDTEYMDIPDLISRFSLERVNKSNAVFDLQKLDWLNATYIGRMTADVLYPLMKKELEEAGLWESRYGGEAKDWFLGLLEALKSRAKNFTNFVALCRPYLVLDFPYDPKAVKKRLKDPVLEDCMKDLRRAYEVLTPFTMARAEEAIRKLAETRGVKAGTLIHALRTGLTGQLAGPGIFEIVQLMGREKTLARLEKLIDFLGGRNSRNPENPSAC
jgi:glutamyl-tRNA synthetase